MPICRNPAWAKKSHTLLVLLTSTFTRSRASRRLSLPPRRAYSRTRVSLITRYGLGRIRSWEHKVCSAGVRRCSDGLFARLSGAAEQKGLLSHPKEEIGTARTILTRFASNGGDWFGTHLVVVRVHICNKRACTSSLRCGPRSSRAQL